MRIVIEKSEFRTLSRGTQQELIERLTGKLPGGGKRGHKEASLHWRKPLDLTEDMAARLLHGLSESHKKRLELFVKGGGRVRQQELLAATGDTDLRALSHFQAVLTRRLRRFLDDPERQIYLIGWDFGAEQWDKSHTKLLDGVYFVSDKTAEALRTHLGGGGATG
jgi:hypothetical protein